MRVLPRDARGFALVLTITLLAFLVLILVALASLTRVETQVASNHQQLAQARQNALMALNIALGQLQKYAGPDQRTTARADLQHGSTAANARWTGVYGSAVPAGYGQRPSDLATALTTKTDLNTGSAARLLTWLVSGNEDNAFNPATDVGEEGEILKSSFNPTYAPSAAVSGLDSEADALSDKITIQGTPARLLVGRNTVSNDVALDYVAAPLVPIDVPTKTLPGFADDGGTQTIGRYAWWVGDEGLKARLNLPAPATLAEKTAAWVSAPRAAVELMHSMGNLYDPAAGVNRLLAPNQLPMLAKNEDDADALRDATRFHFHDLTPYSYSILSDAAAGGLKLDLSSALAAGAAAPAGTDFLFPSEPGGAYAVPTWAHLRSFAQPVAVSDTGAVTPRLPTAAGDSGISPVLTYFALGFQCAKDDSGGSVRLALFPLIILWNPYTVPLAAADYEVGFVKRYNYAKFKLQAQTASGAWEDRETPRDLRRGATATGTVHSYIRFRVSTQEIPPGQSLVFTLTGNDSGQPYIAGENRLTNALDPGGHAYMPGPAIAAGESAANYRVVLTDPDNFVGGDMDVYLGSPQSTSPVGYDPAGKSWYQTIQRVGSTGNIGSNPVIQGPAPLSTVTEPAFSLRVQAVFSGLSESNISAGLKIRWIAQANPRAPLVTRLPGDTLSNVTYGGFIGRGGVSDWQHFLPSASGTRASAGPGHDCDPDPVDVTLFELPRSGQPLLSLGQLQHAPLSLISGYPAYAFGNSLADYRVDADRLHLTPTLTSSDNAAATNLLHTHYDLSWLLNHALWDRAFFSSVPAGAIPPALPTNPRHVRLDDYTGAELQQPERAAAHLLLAGGFNINSTSEQAWRAVLGGLNRLAYNPLAATDSTALDGAPLARFARPTADDKLATPWQGYRLLTENQIAQLARNVVAEIRARGPFVNLADFVNRRLVDNDKTDPDERLKGTLQAALDATTTVGSESFPINDAATAPFRVADGLANVRPTGARYFSIEHSQGVRGTDPVAPYSSRSAFAPKFLTQADILSAIGAGLAARSDTFVIRAYGETVNPVLDETDRARITGRAWCEAVVQRLPDYVNPADAAYDAPTAPDNQRFGRRFKIVSFRWLSPSDI